MECSTLSPTASCPSEQWPVERAAAIQAAEITEGSIWPLGMDLSVPVFQLCHLEERSDERSAVASYSRTGDEPSRNCDYFQICDNLSRTDHSQPSITMTKMRRGESMNRRPRFALLWPVVVLILTMRLSGQQCQGEKSPVLPIGNQSVVRFYFLGENYFHPPILFQAVDRGDNKLNTAPMQREGRTIYITSAEMSSLLMEISNRGFEWSITTKRETLADATEVRPVYEMGVTIVSSKGTACAGLARISHRRIADFGGGR
jgi:hypothetical protein